MRRVSVTGLFDVAFLAELRLKGFGGDFGVLAELLRILEKDLRRTFWPIWCRRVG